MPRVGRRAGSRTQASEIQDAHDDFRFRRVDGRLLRRQHELNIRSSTTQRKYQHRRVI